MNKVVLIFPDIKLIRPKLDIAGLMMNWLILLFAVFVLPVTLIFSMLQLDPIYLITRELVLSKMDQNVSLNNFVTILSVILFSSSGCILFKFLFIFVYILTLLLSHANNYACTFNAANILTKILQLKYYIVCRVFMLILRGFISELMIHFIIGGQMVLTTFSWMTINCAHMLPKFVILCTATTVIGGLVMWITVLKIALHVKLYSAQLLNRRRNEYLKSNKNKFRYYFVAKWRAQNELKISCGNHFTITKNAVNIFITVLNTNITDSILLVVP